MASKIGKILVVDDNLGIRRALEILLPVHFAEVRTIPSPASLVSSLEQFRPDVVLLDMNFNTSINTGNEGLYWAGEIKKMAPDVEVVLFTAYADIALAVEGMKRGAFDFLVKPWENDKLVEVLTAARDKARKSMGRDARSGSPSDIPGSTSVIPGFVTSRCECCHQLLIIPGLHDEIERTTLHSFNGQLNIGISREENDFHLRHHLLDLPGPVEPFVSGIDVRVEIHIQQHNIRSETFQRADQRNRRR